MRSNTSAKSMTPVLIPRNQFLLFTLDVQHIYSRFENGIFMGLQVEQKESLI
jgi:hypothetical protein